jgi:RNA polymerase sigma-32 factor
MAADLGVDAKVVMQMEGRMSAHDTPFDAPEGEDDSAYQAPAYYLEDHSGDPARQLEASDWEEDSNTRLATAMGDLDPRSRDILQQRWLSNSKATLHNLADQYEVSAERIRQLEKNAMKKLKAAMSVGMENNGEGAYAF